MSARELFTIMERKSCLTYPGATGPALSRRKDRKIFESRSTELVSVLFWFVFFVVVVVVLGCIIC